LLKDRIVFLGTPVTDEVANSIIAQLLFLESDDPEKGIDLYINSPGGSVTAGLAIYDTMQYIRPEVTTICLGQAASMGALLLSSGQKGKRLALPHSRILIHQPLLRGGLGGQATDIEIQAREIIRLKQKLQEILDGLQAERHYDYILNYGPGTGVLMVNDSLDITNVVLERLNRQENSGE